MDQEKIGCFLKQLRRERGLTQEQLAEQLGSIPARSAGGKRPAPCRILRCWWNWGGGTA